MKKITNVSAILFCTPLIAMFRPNTQIKCVTLKLATKNLIQYKIMTIPAQEEKCECGIRPFLFTLIRNTYQTYPSFDLIIKTDDKYKTVVDQIECPLLPHSTTKSSFTHNGQPYDVNVEPTAQ